MSRTQETPIETGAFKEMVRDLVSRLPTTEVDGAYTTEPAWYHRMVGELFKLPRNSDGARQVERILSTGALTIATLANQYAEERVTPMRSCPDPWPILTPQQWAEGYQKAHPDLDASCIVEMGDGLVISAWCDQRVFWRPNLLRLGKVLDIKKPYDQYGLVLQHLAGLLLASYGERNFYNYREGALTEKHVRLLKTTREYMEYTDRNAAGDYVAEIGSSGLTYAGYSVRNARGDIEATTDRWAWPAFVVGNILLVDHVRLGSNGLLHIDCPGDEYDPGGESEFEFCLCFRFDDRLEFDYAYVGHPYGYWGSAAGLRR